MIKVRHTDEWVGALVIAAVAVMIFAALQAGVLRDWFKPTSDLRLILPAAGVGGLEVGGDVEILGTRAGMVTEIVLDPDQQMYALIELDEQASPFIRRDSTAVIRRRFGVAGAAFVDISRGVGEELDWTYAVIEATTERAPTDNISALIDEMREKVFPILDNAGLVTQSLAEITGRINRGEGSIGRLVVDATLIDEAEAAIVLAREDMAALNLLIAELQKSAGNVSVLTQELGEPDGIPALVARANASLATAQQVLDDIAVASKRAPAIARNLESTTENLPALVSQLQVTIRKAEQLIAQIGNSWLLGGGGAKPQEPNQFSPSQVLP